MTRLAQSKRSCSVRSWSGPDVSCILIGCLLLECTVMRRMIIGAALAALITCPALADNNDTATVNVTGNIVASLEIGTVVDLTMPDVVAPHAEAVATVTLECDNAGASATRTYTGNSNPFADGSAAAANPAAGSANAGVGDAVGVCGQVPISGEGSFNYQVAFGGFTTVGNVSVTAANCTSANDGTSTVLSTGDTAILDGGGADTLYCGATVQVASAQTAAAAYSVAFDVTVTYD